MILQAQEFAALDTHRDLFSRLQDKRIFVSGGTGFLGKWLLESFLYFNKLFVLNACMTILSRAPQEFLFDWPEFREETALEFIQGDVRDFEFPLGRYDLIIHAAAEVDSTGTPENAEEACSVMVEGTRRILDFTTQAGASRLMVMSSGAVYGPQPDAMSHVSEIFKTSPVTSYGKAKLLAEEISVEAGNRHGFSVVLPRCFTFVGPYLNLDIHYAIGNFIRDCLEGRPIVIKGDGTALRSYMYAADLTEWLWTILLNGTHARPYNVGSADTITIRDLAHRVRDCAGTSHPIEIRGASVSNTSTDRYVPSIERASSELNVKPRYSLDEAIRRTLAWQNARRGFR